MDARIEAEPMGLGGLTLVTPKVKVEKVDVPVLMPVGLFDAASILVSLLSQGLCSVSAVAPDYIFEGEVSGHVLLG